MVEGREEQSAMKKKIDSAEVSSHLVVENYCTATGLHLPDHGKPNVETVAHSDEMSTETHQDDVHRSWK